MKKQILVSLILAASMISSANAADAKKKTAKAAKPAATTMTPAAAAVEATEVAANTVEASSNTTSAKASDLQKKDEKVAGDIDQEITNAKMRAESGSKSKWSMNADLTYSGGNLETPFGAQRPNYSGEASQQGVTSIAGTVGASYRINPKNRISMGTGVAILTPFQSRGEDMLKMTEDGGKSDVSTPYITWSTAGRIGTVQNSLSVSYNHATSDYDLNTLKNTGAFVMSHTMIFEISGSNWQPGWATTLVNNLYSDSAAATDIVGNPDRRSDYSIGLYPFIEYAFNDRYSFRTVFRPFIYSHMRDDEADTFERSMYTQSVGLGIAVTRDIYLYPNMQFAPENLKPELTNVGLSTIVSLF
ncbi:hypothetical protein D3C87_260170 [compost metagenome]